MRKKRRILFAALLIVVVGALALLSLRPRELSYEGKPLSAWLLEYFVSRLNGTSGGTDGSQAEQAIRKIGTNAIPAYVKWLGEKDSPLKEKAIALLRKQSFLEIPLYTASEHRLLGSLGLGILGSNAAPAVPALIAMLNSNGDPEVREQVVRSLQTIGPPAAEAVPTLVQMLKDTNRFAQLHALDAIAAIHSRPEMSVPALIQFLEDTNKRFSDRCEAAQALGAFGEKARPAIPVFLPLLNHGDYEIRDAAAYALKQIDPEAAARAGVK